MIYLDSAATSLLKPPSVAHAASMAIRTMASPGRGGHSAAMRAADTVFACRAAAAALFHVPEPERVVFTMNATHALDIAIHSLVSPGDPVVISGYEHNSVTRPLHALGAQVRIAGDDLIIKGVDAFTGGEVDSHNDHRIAMMAAIAASRATGEVVIHGAEAVNKSYPDFFDHYRLLGGKVTLEEE